MQAITPILARQNKEIGKSAVYNYYPPAGYRFDHMSAWEWIEAFVPGGHGRG
jgi:monoamine oxidase